MVSSPPITLGGEIFLDLNYLGVIALNFFHLGGKSNLGGTDRYLGGITLWAFWDIHIYYFFKVFACGGLCLKVVPSVIIAFH